MAQKLTFKFSRLPGKKEFSGYIVSSVMLKKKKHSSVFIASGLLGFSRNAVYSV